METDRLQKIWKINFLVFPPAALLIAIVLFLLGWVNLAVLVLVPICCMVVSLVIGFVSLRREGPAEIPADIRSRRMKKRIVCAILSLAFLYLMSFYGRYMVYASLTTIAFLWAWNELNYLRYERAKRLPKKTNFHCYPRM